MMFLRPLNRRLVTSYSRVCIRTVHEDKYISVREFYKDKNVLITGCTGFVGHGLVEKLLRSCPDIGRIYLPIRVTKNKDVEQRFRTFINNTVFDNLRATDFDFENKLMPLAASLEKPNLGLCENAFEFLTNEINVIYHVAALIKFNPPLREAIRSNVLTSTNVFRFGKQCKHLAAYVHVSTIFAHLDLDSVDEKVYPTVWDHNELIELNEVKSDRQLKRLKREVVGASPGSYFATKKVGEYMTKLESGETPVGIIRPGKVSPAWREPTPGWATKMGSFIPWMTLVEKGDVRYLMGDPNHREEIIPVDLCVNSLITTAWYLGTHKLATKHCKEPLVVHVQSSSVNELTTQTFVSFVNQYLKEDGRSRLVILDRSRLRLAIRSGIPTLLRTIRDIIAERPPMTLFVYVFGLCDKSLHTIQVRKNPHPKEYRTLMEIENLLSDSDRKDYSSDITRVNWEEYIKTWLRTLKEKREDRKRRNKMDSY